MASKTKRDLLTSLGSQIGYKLIGFLTVALLARHLDKDDYGRLTMSLSLCAAAVLFTDLGLSSDLVRKVAVKPSRIQALLTTTLSTRVPLVFAFVVCINVVVAIVKPDLLPVVAGISVYTALKDLQRTYSSAFTGLRRIKRSIASFSSGIIVILTGVALASYLDLPKTWVLVAYVAGGATMLLVGATLFSGIHGSIRPTFSWNIIRNNAFRAFGLFALSGLSYVHYALDTITLGFLSTYQEVANYEVASRLYEASQFAIRPVTLIMFPISAKLVSDGSWLQFRSLLNRMFLASAGIGIFAWLITLALAGQILSFIYSAAYANSAPILQLLFGATPFLYIATVGLFVSASQNRESFACIIVLSAILVKILANLWAIPNYGPYGAAVVNLATQASMAIVLCIDAYRAIPKVVISNR